MPTEILCTIFDTVLDYAAKYRDIIVLTAVCRHWRKVAIAYPQLWTRIFTGMPVKHLGRFLRRSHGLPLDFSISGTWANADHWNHFFEHIGRCRKISISDIPAQWLSEMAEWVDSPAPILEELELAALPSANAHDVHNDVTLFDQTTPNLWRVRIDTLRLPRSAFAIFLNITHLEFAFGHGVRSRGQSVNGILPSQTYLLHILTCAPMLQDAIFERYGTTSTPYFHDYDRNNHPRVKLEHLDRLVLQGMAPQEMGFLNVLDVPLECNIRLGVDLAKHQSFGPFLEILENSSGGLRNLFRVQETTFAGSSSTNPDRWAVHLWDGDSKLVFAIIFRNTQSKEQTETLIWLIARVLFKRYNPTCLAWSNMTSQFIASSGIFIRVLLSHPGITDLAFDDCDFVSEALTLILASEKTKESVAPNLSYLALLRCAGVPPQLLVDLARAKDMRKMGFRKLRVRECPQMIRRAMNDLRWWVEHVEWDQDEDWDGWSLMADVDSDETRDVNSVS